MKLSIGEQKLLLKNTLHKIGDFCHGMTIEKIEEGRIFLLDNSGEQIIFTLRQLSSKSIMETDFSHSRYRSFIAKKIDGNHYRLYDSLDDDFHGDVYLNSKNILCVFTDYRKTEILYRNKTKMDIEYKITVEKDEILEPSEFEEFARDNEHDEPQSLHSFLKRFTRYRAINRCSSIYVSSRNKNKIIGEIMIKHGILEQYKIDESEIGYNLNMSKNGHDIIVSSTNTYDHQEVPIEDLPMNLQSSYQEGIKLLQKYNKRSL